MKLQKTLTMTGPSPSGSGAAPMDCIHSIRSVSKYLRYIVLLTCRMASMSPQRIGMIISWTCFFRSGNSKRISETSSAAASCRSEAEAVVGLQHGAVDEVALVGAQHQQR